MAVERVQRALSDAPTVPQSDEKYDGSSEVGNGAENTRKSFGGRDRSAGSHVAVFEKFAEVQIHQAPDVKEATNLRWNRVSN